MSAGAVLGYVANSAPILLATVPAGIFVMVLSAAVAKTLARIIEAGGAALMRRWGLSDTEKAKPAKSKRS